MYAQALLFVVMLGKLFRKLFFGQLRAAEFEVSLREWLALQAGIHLKLIPLLSSTWWKGLGTP